MKMVQKIYKGSDVLIQLGLKDADGNPYRINSLTSFTIRFFTTDPETYIESCYQNGEYVGILNEEDADYIIINASDLESLEEGIMHYTYSIRAVNTDFDDGFYDEAITGESNLYLKSEYCNE